MVGRSIERLCDVVGKTLVSAHEIHGWYTDGFELVFSDGSRLRIEATVDMGEAVIEVLDASEWNGVE